MQADTHDEVEKIKTCFPSTVWKREVYNDNSEWQHTAKIEGIHVKIYGCPEAPPQCKKVEREVTQIKKVPTAFKEQEVTETVIEWECGKDA